MRIRAAGIERLSDTWRERAARRSTRHTWRRLVAASLGVVLAAVISAGSQPAFASGSNIEFSTDGVNYSAALSGSLFRASIRMVPGDTQTSTFWIRNNADSAGFLRLVLSKDSRTDPALANALTLRIQTDSFVDQRVTLNRASPCWALVNGDILDSGAVVKVIATLTLGNLNGSEGQNASAYFALRTGLSDASAGSLPPSSCDGTSTGIDGFGPAPLANPSGVAGSPNVIAYTGYELPYPLLIASAGALVVGLFLLIAARRRRREDG